MRRRALLLSTAMLFATTAHPQALDLDDPATIVDAYVRTVGDTSGKPSYLYANVVVMAMTPGERGQKLFGLEVLGASRFLPIDGGYQRLHREVGLYTDLETGEVLSTWDNPLNERAVEVIHIQNDPVNFPYTVEQQSGPRKIVFDELGPYIAFHREVLLRYPSALKRAEYPLHSAGDWYEAAELFNSFALKSDLEDKSKTSVPEIGTWSRVGPWLPWMEMADAPGHLLYHGRSFKLMDGVEELREGLRDYIATNMPKFLEAPEEMSEPNQTSWTYFKDVLDERREREAAPQ